MNSVYVILLLAVLVFCIFRFTTWGESKEKADTER